MIESTSVLARVFGVFVYPLKGAAGIPLGAAELDGLGFVHDRRWMVVDERGEFISQRTRPRLALIRPVLEGDALVLQAPGAPELRLPADQRPSGQERVRVWEDEVRAASAGEDAARWITEFLGVPARIVRLARETDRPVDPRYAPRPADRVAFVDGYPCLLISQASLDLLNRRLEKPIPMNRFRPNLIVAGTGPHAEDGWRRIRLGDVAFDVVKPCGRCAVTTVDQDTGTAGQEPLRTLSTYRKVGSKVLFGQNLVHASRGTVRVGDVVQVEVKAEGGVRGNPETV